MLHLHSNHCSPTFPSVESSGFKGNQKLKMALTGETSLLASEQPFTNQWWVTSQWLRPSSHTVQYYIKKNFRGQFLRKDPHQRALLRRRPSASRPPLLSEDSIMKLFTYFGLFKEQLPTVAPLSNLTQQQIKMRSGPFQTVDLRVITVAGWWMRVTAESGPALSAAEIRIISKSETTASSPTWNWVDVYSRQLWRTDCLPRFFPLSSHFWGVKWLIAQTCH